jgi:GntR family transcriptional repressor for pyruvate dehydrogenase complex
MPPVPLEITTGTKLTGRVRPVQKAYEQIAGQLRDLIIDGQLGPGQRLPSEAALAAQFGASRPTVREALRVLSSQNLVRTSKGTTGGSFVTRPTAAHISDYLNANMSLFSQTDNVTLDEFLEARALLEIPAAKIAARRHDSELTSELREEIPADPGKLTQEQRFLRNRGFHSVLVEAAGNSLLAIAAQPVFFVLQTHLKRSDLGLAYQQHVSSDHRRIVTAVEEGDVDEVERAMLDHLEFLRPHYEHAWRLAAEERER